MMPHPSSRYARWVLPFHAAAPARPPMSSTIAILAQTGKVPKAVPRNLSNFSAALYRRSLILPIGFLFCGLSERNENRDSRRAQSPSKFAVRDQQRFVEVLQERLSGVAVPDANVIAALLQYFADLIYGQRKRRYGQQLYRRQPLVKARAPVKHLLPHAEVQCCFRDGFTLRDKPLKFLHHGCQLYEVLRFRNVFEVLNQLEGHAQFGFILKHFTARRAVQPYHFYPLSLPDGRRQFICIFPRCGWNISFTT
jgi:hypothetical protein